MIKNAKYYRSIMDKAIEKKKAKEKEVIKENKEKYKNLIEEIEEIIQKSAEEGFPFTSFVIREDEGDLKEIKDIIFDLYSSEDGFITTTDIDYKHKEFSLIVEIRWGDDE